MIKKALSLIPDMYQWIVAWFIPKDNNIWIFGAIRGQKYMDNAKYIFEYVHNNTDINAIWISKNEELVRELKSKGFSAFYEYTKEAKYFAKRAKIAVVTHRGSKKNADLPFYLFSKKTKIIQLWHGIPLKKIAFDDKIFSNRYKENTFKFKSITFIKKIFFPFLSYIHEPSLILALSKETQNIFSQAFRTNKNLVKITGYPRTDILLGSRNKNLDTSRQQKIIYMPTFRGSVDSDFNLFLDYGFDIIKLDNFLEQNNMKMDIKLHPFNSPSDELIEELEKSNNISLLNYDAIYEILNHYDVLVTDYSSIYFDYLLLDRAIIFTPFDKNEYLKNNREFYFEYDSVTPGPKANNWDEVMLYLKSYIEKPSIYSEERNLLKNKFHTYQDTKSTLRVYKEILKVSKFS